ncbi:hypothetical protein [uncultured Erythrobacter sp.]|uniref:hypothetical protein n=1 Tax=uncultured Erythrobacter sp. TaxID=263913 RepID=UPI00260952D8|nr:hypothetical protein [uncultured Erythrobacter sp.]
MKFLNTKFHGIIDYLAAIGLIVGPLVLFPAGTASLVTAIPIVAGIALIAYSLITDYSASARRIIPFSLHLAIDLMAGTAFVALSFLLGLTGITQTFYLVMGVAVIAVVLVSENEEAQTTLAAA